MKTKGLIIINFLIFFSCTNEKKVYDHYDSGEIKKVYLLKNGEKNGVEKIFYRNGKLKRIQNFKNGIGSDSVVYYYPDSSNLSKITEKLFINDSLKEVVFFDHSGRKIIEGKVLMKNPDKRIGIWKFHNKKNDSLVEYLLINNKSYTNQIWIIKNKDTLLRKSNYFKSFIPKTVRRGEVLRLRFYLEAPFFSSTSDLEILMPASLNSINSNFSNFNLIEKDTFPSLLNDGIPHPEVPKKAPINHIVEFGLKFKEKGVKKIRGVLLEFVENDSTARTERRLYFEEEINVF